MMPITALYAALLALLAVLLANLVLRVRVNARRYPHWKADATMRVQANFIENVPLAVVLLYLLEVGGVSGGIIHGFGATLVVMRLLHAWGLASYEGANYPRLIGAQGTFLLISIMAMLALYRFVLPIG
ncbi:MAG: MAPEG family protein [Pseudomonadaceae bacterium]|nr:MAPEG family protein [Pseudomonadaceae bacterium]